MKSLTTLSVLELLTRDQQIELYNTLSEKLVKPPGYKSARDRINEIQEKYCALIWMARTDEELLEERPDIRGVFNRTVAKYPGELEKLQEYDGDWHHGFNSGMLACARLLHPYTLPDNFHQVYDHDEDEDGNEIEVAITRDSEVEFMEEEFPMLDT